MTRAARDLAHALSFPVFVKGAVKSNKEQGFKAVVAQNMDELRNLAEDLERLKASEKTISGTVRRMPSTTTPYKQRLH